MDQPTEPSTGDTKTKTRKNQHWVPQAHQLGFIDPESWPPPNPSGSFDTSSVKTFLYSAKSVGAADVRVNLKANFTGDYTYDIEGVSGLQADRTVITEEEHLFTPLFRTARDRQSLAGFESCMFELITHRVRRSPALVGQALSWFDKEWERCWKSVDFEWLSKQRHSLLARVVALHAVRPDDVAVQGLVASCLQWSSVISWLKSVGLTFEDVLAVQPKLKYKQPLYAKKVPNQAEVKAAVKSQLKGGWLRALLNTPLKNNSYTQRLIDLFDLAVIENNNAATPYILTDHVMVYEGVNGHLYQMSSQADLDQIARILLPLCSTRLVVLTRKPDPDAPFLQFDLSPSHVNEWLARAATEKYIAPVGGYPQWTPVIGKAMWMPSEWDPTSLQDDIFDWGTLSKEAESMLKLLREGCTAEEGERLDALGAPRTAALLFPPVAPQNLPTTLDAQEAPVSLAYRVYRPRRKEDCYSVKWKPLTVFKLVVPKGLCFDVRLSANTSTADLRCVSFKISIFNGSQEVEKRIRAGRATAGSFISTYLLSVSTKVNNRQLLVQKRRRTPARVFATHTGDYLVVIEGFNNKGAVVYKKQIWVQVV